MAKRNVQNTKKMVEEPIDELNGVGEPSGTEAESKTTTVEESSSTENVQEELSNQPKQNNGEQTDGTERADLDTKDETRTDGTEGNEADNPVMEDDPEEVYKEAKTIIGKMVDEAIDESGILDEPKEITEKRNRIANDVFQKNSSCKSLHFSSDLVPFFVKSDAVRHGATLKDDTIVTINRK